MLSLRSAGGCLKEALQYPPNTIMEEKTVREAILYRRSIRLFKPDRLDMLKVKDCLELAALAPNSSNMQLWEFYHITSQEKLKEVQTACFNQLAAKNAQQLVVIVVRKDLWNKRAKANAGFLTALYNKPFDTYTKKEKNKLRYFRLVMPILYFDFLGIAGLLKWAFACVVGLFRPMIREVSYNDIRIVAQKSAALAAENFMISMSAIHYDTCAMEGYDSVRLKKTLNLPFGAEINMVIGCGIRSEEGINPRFRVPFEQIYHQK